MNTESHKLIPIVEILLPAAFCSSFWYVLQSLFIVLVCMWKIWSKSTSCKAEVSYNESCSEDRTVVKVASDTNKTISPEAKYSDNNANEALTMQEIETVMKNLGTSYDTQSNKLQGKLSSNDINALFEEQEPSAEEVEQAFSIFDENNDGFIDAKELRKILLKLFITEVSEEDCKRMIRAFDDNGDELIDFNEFARLLTCSFSL